MTKVALLIGVSDYQTGFKPLPAATNDVEAVRRVLRDPDMGGFAPTDITTLFNPDPQRMREAVVTLFKDRRKDDLLLLYFSGHGVTDDQGAFYLTCSYTRSESLEATAIPADFVHRLMENSRSKRQVVVLDCCFSGAFAKGMSVKGGEVNLSAQLGGEGRAILASSSATEYSFEQKESDLSVYTRYWVEGIEKGAADTNGNGWISVDELHDYTSRKVRESTPAMKPRIYAAEEGFNIILSKAPVGDPHLEYRKEVERLAQERKGQFSPILVAALEEKRLSLAVSPKTANTIQAEVLRPYRELETKLKRFEQAVTAALQQASGLSQRDWSDLCYLQQALGLRDADVESINTRIPRHVRRANLQPDPSQAKSVVDPAQRKPTVPLVIGGITLAAIGGFFSIPALLSTQTAPSPQPVASLSPSSSPTPTPTQSISPEKFFNQGREKQNKGDYQGALADYTEAIRIKPDYADAYKNRGAVKLALGDNQGAIVDSYEAIRLKPDFAEAYNNRGIAKSALGDRQGAMADYSEAIRIKPDLAIAYSNRGFLKATLGDKQGAIADYTEAVRLKPDLAIAYRNRGDAKSALGDQQGAVKDYTAFIQLQSDDATVYHSRGVAHELLGDLQDALADYSEAIRIKPDFAISYLGSGNIKLALDDWQGAIADFTKAIQLNYPDLYLPYANRGIAKSNLGDRLGAIEDFTDAIRLKSDYADAYYNRGNAKATLGETQGAIADFTAAAQLYQQQRNMDRHRNTLNRIEQLQRQS